MVPAERVDAFADAAEIRRRARAEAEQLLDEARQVAEAEAKTLRRSAAEAGRAEAAALAAAAEVSRQRALAAVQDDVIDLAMEVGRKLVGRELEVSRTAAADICARALDKVRRARAVLIRVNPADLEQVRQGQGLLGAALVSEDAALRVEADEGVSRGGCVVDTDIGKVDASLEVQLAALEEALRDVDA